MVRFAAVGCFNTVLDTSLLLIFNKLIGLPVLLSNTCSSLVAVSVSYFLNHSIVFRSSDKYSVRKYFRFLLITGASIIIVQNVVIYLITGVLWQVSPTQQFSFLEFNINLQTAILLFAKMSAVLVSMIWNFLLYKYVVFNTKSTDKADELTMV